MTSPDTTTPHTQLVKLLREEIDRLETEALGELRRDGLQPFEAEGIVMKFAAKLRAWAAPAPADISIEIVGDLEEGSRQAAAELAAAATPPVPPDPVVIMTDVTLTDTGPVFDPPLEESDGPMVFRSFRVKDI